MFSRADQKYKPKNNSDDSGNYGNPPIICKAKCIHEPNHNNNDCGNYCKGPKDENNLVIIDLLRHISHPPTGFQISLPFMVLTFLVIINYIHNILFLHMTLVIEISTIIHVVLFRVVPGDNNPFATPDGSFMTIIFEVSGKCKRWSFGFIIFSSFDGLLEKSYW